MKFEEILPAIKNGRGFRRETSMISSFYKLSELHSINTVDILCGDWELEPLPPKPITLDNLIKAWREISPITPDKSLLFLDFVKALGYTFPALN